MPVLFYSHPMSTHNFPGHPSVLPLHCSCIHLILPVETIQECCLSLPITGRVYVSCTGQTCLHFLALLATSIISPCPPHWANPTYHGRQVSSTSSYSTSLPWPPQVGHHFLLSAQGCEGCPIVGASPPSSALTHWTHSRWTSDEHPRE